MAFESNFEPNLFVEEFSTVTSLSIVVFNLLCQNFNLLFQFVHFKFIFSNNNFMLLELLLKFGKTLENTVLPGLHGRVAIPTSVLSSSAIDNESFSRSIAVRAALSRLKIFVNSSGHTSYPKTYLSSCVTSVELSDSISTRDSSASFFSFSDSISARRM